MKQTDTGSVDDDVTRGEDDAAPVVLSERITVALIAKAGQVRGEDRSGG